MEVSKINDDMWKIKTVVLTILLLTKCTWSCTYSWMDHLWESLTGLLTCRKRHRGEKTWTQRRSLICSKSETTGGVCGLVLPSAPTNNPKQTEIRVKILSCDPYKTKILILTSVRVPISAIMWHQGVVFGLNVWFTTTRSSVAGHELFSPPYFRLFLGKKIQINICFKQTH